MQLTRPDAECDAAQDLVTLDGNVEVTDIEAGGLGSGDDLERLGGGLLGHAAIVITLRS